jgi:Icc-related predicted phosphoesterase
MMSIKLLASAMKLLALSDYDSFRYTLGKEPADVLISCGDIADQVILEVAEAVQCSRILAVRGNHDNIDPFQAPILDLHLTTYTYDGIRFGGFNGSWRYKPRGNYLYEQPEVEQLLRTFPPVDVFVAHNSPRHIHDRDDNVHLGFKAFVDYIHRVHPRLFLHGHQHMNKETCIGGTRVIGVRGQKRLEI